MPGPFRCVRSCRTRVRPSTGSTSRRSNDKTGQIVINLTSPNGSFLQILAIPFSAIVPPNTPDKDQTPNPPPSTGGFVISSSNPGHEWVLSRNPQWAKNNAKIMPQLPTPHLDKITEKVVPNQASGTAQVEQNKADLLYDPPPTDLLGAVQSKYSTRFKPEATVSTYYFWMNTSKTTAGGVPNPFSDLKVRQAINYAIDPTAIQKLYGGLLQPTQQILPCRHGGLQEDRAVPAQPQQGEAAHRPGAPAFVGEEHHRLDRRRRAELERRPVLPVGAPEARLQREAERRERPDVLHDARQPEDAGSEHRMVRTGIRTSRTPTTSSSRC